MSDAPPTVPGQTEVRPNRGGLILAFGILSIVLCMIFGIIAWIMANGDLREMDAGRMDPSGHGLTQAGKILGIVGVILQGLLILLWILIVALGVGGMVAGAAAGSGSGP